jgi:hypothetical protein
MSSSRSGQSVDSKALTEVLKDYIERIQAINFENPGEIRDYPSLLQLAILSNLQSLLTNLAKLQALEGQAFEAAFSNILKEQWRLTQGTVLDVFNSPDNESNSCLKKILKLIDPGLTEEGLLLKCAPGLKKIIRALPSKSAQGKMDFELKTEAIDPGALEEVPPDDRIVVGDALFSASSLFPCFAKVDFLKKIRHDLEEKYPELYAELLEKRADLCRVFDVLTQERPSPREALIRLMKALKYSGSRFSGQHLSGELANKGIDYFREYMDSLAPEFKAQVYALKSGNHSVDSIVNHDLLGRGDCVETAATNLTRILETPAHAAVLDTAPPQPSKEQLQKSFKEAIKPFEGDEQGEYVFSAKKSVKIPPELADPLLKNIKIQDAIHLIAFLQNLDAEYFEKLSLAEVNPLVKDAEELQYVLFHLDSYKQKVFCRYAAQHLELFSSLKNCVAVLKNANPEQRLLILDILKDRLLAKGNQKGLIQDNWEFNQFLGNLNEGELHLVLPALKEALLAPENQHFLGRWEFRRLLFKERAEVYLKALGPAYLKSVIRNAEDRWEWERNLPSLAAVKVLHEQLGQPQEAQSSSSSSLYHQAFKIDEAFIKHYEGHKFAQHIVLGEPAKAIEMLEAKPELLNAEEEVIDYYGNHIQMPAYQLPRCIEDDEMAEMFEPHIDRVKNAQEIKANLNDLEKWIEKTGGFEDPERIAKDKAALIKLIKDLKEAPKKAKPPEARESAMEAFRVYLRPKAGQVIRKGKICNTQLLDQGYDYYDKEYKALGGKDYETSPENDALWVGGIGTIQRSLTTCFIQAIGQSLFDRLEELKQKKPQSRELEFRYDPGTFLLPLVPLSGFGYKYAVGDCSGVDRRHVAHVLFAVVSLRNYVEQNHQHFDRLGSDRVIHQRRDVP